MGEHAIGMLRKFGENHIFLWGEMHVLPLMPNTASEQVDFEPSIWTVAHPLLEMR